MLHFAETAATASRTAFTRKAINNKQFLSTPSYTLQKHWIIIGNKLQPKHTVQFFIIS